MDDQKDVATMYLYIPTYEDLSQRRRDLELIACNHRLASTARRLARRPPTTPPADPQPG